jgi:hypothetical protein
MVTPEEKEMLFKLWNQLGVDMRSAKYMGINFDTPDGFKLLVAEFYGLKKDTKTDTLIALEQDLKGSLNEFFSLPENRPCGGTVRMIGNGVLQSNYFAGVEKKFISLMGMFAYSIPEDFRCNDIEVYIDIEPEYRVDECFTDDCLRPLLNNAENFVRKKYGLVLNHYQLYNENNVVGDIPIKKYS